MMQQLSDIVTTSFVVPVYGGEDYLAELVAQIDKLRHRWREVGLDLLIIEAILFWTSRLTTPGHSLAGKALGKLGL
jgi:hypothetical protein